VSPKVVYARTYAYIEDARVVDVDRQQKHGSQYSFLNLDIGVVQEFGYVWKAAFVARDVLPHSLAWADGSGEALKLQPHVVAGLSVRLPRAILAIDADITAGPVLGSERPGRRVAGGAELMLGEYWRLRAGVPVDYDGQIRPGLAVGVGLHTAMVEADVGASGDGDDVTVATRVGFRF
jgi:hypothetical protein